MIPLPDFFDTDYAKKINIFDRQQKAVHDNAEALKFNNAAIENWISANITNRTLGLPESAKPQLKLELMVNDDGTEVTRPFPGLKPLVLPEVNVLQNPGTGFFGADPSKTPADRTDQIIGMLRVLRQEQVSLEIRLMEALKAAK